MSSQRESSQPSATNEASVPNGATATNNEGDAIPQPQLVDVRTPDGNEEFTALMDQTALEPVITDGVKTEKIVEIARPQIIERIVEVPHIQRVFKDVEVVHYRTVKQKKEIPVMIRPPLDEAELQAAIEEATALAIEEASRAVGQPEEVIEEEVIEEQQIEYVDKVVQIPRKIVQEKVIHVFKDIEEERWVENPIYEEVVRQEEVPVVEVREVPKVEIVPQPRIEKRKVIKEIPVRNEHPVHREVPVDVTYNADFEGAEVQEEIVYMDRVEEIPIVVEVPKVVTRKLPTPVDTPVRIPVNLADHPDLASFANGPLARAVLDKSLPKGDFPPLLASQIAAESAMRSRISRSSKKAGTSSPFAACFGPDAYADENDPTLASALEAAPHQSTHQSIHQSVQRSAASRMDQKKCCHGDIDEDVDLEDPVAAGTDLSTHPRRSTQYTNPAENAASYGLLQDTSAIPGQTSAYVQFAAQMDQQVSPIHLPYLPAQYANNVQFIHPQTGQPQNQYPGGGQ